MWRHINENDNWNVLNLLSDITNAKKNLRLNSFGFQEAKELLSRW